jgi:hypothetical protein
MFTPKFGLSNLTVISEGGGLQRVHCIYIPNPQLSHSTISLGLSEPSVWHKQQLTSPSLAPEIYKTII